MIMLYDYNCICIYVVEDMSPARGWWVNKQGEKWIPDQDKELQLLLYAAAHQGVSGHRGRKTRASSNLSLPNSKILKFLNFKIFNFWDSLDIV